MKTLSRLAMAFAALAALVLTVPRPNASLVLAASAPAVSLNTANAGPRALEDTTEKAVARDYATAWQAMAEALDQNRADLLSGNFIGAAKDKLTATIEEQQKSGLHQRILDQGHQVDLVFYSPEGSAIEVHDRARLQLQLLDGSKVIHSEDATVHYVALLTAAENAWKVRVLQAVPSF